MVMVSCAPAPINSELAAARSALTAAREVVVARPSSRTATRCTGRARPASAQRTSCERPGVADTAVLEERVAAQVESLNEKFSAGFHDSERALRAAMSRIEPRVRSLEGQGIRTDRRATELASLAKALSEEQRSLLQRLNRLEGEPWKNGREDRGGNTEELLCRISKLEKDQQAARDNMRLIVDVSEESQQRQTKRLQNLDELLESRLSAVEEELKVRPAEASPSDVCGSQNDTKTNRMRDHCTALAAELNAAERRAGEVLQMCGGDVSFFNEESSLRSRLDGNERELASLRIRLEAIPTKEQLHANADTVREVRRQLSSLAENVLAANSDELTRMVKANAEAIQELRGHLRSHGVDQSRMEALSQTVEGLRGKLHEPSSGCVEDMHMRLDMVSREYSERVGAIANRVDDHAQTLERLQYRVDADIPAELRDMRVQVGSTAAIPQQPLPARMSDQLMQQASELAELRSRMDELLLLPSHHMRDATSYVDESQELMQDFSRDRSVTKSKFADEIFDVRQRCISLQDTVEQNVQVSLWNLERQQREASEKVDGIISEFSQQCAQLQEHNVRLDLSLAKLDSNEQKCQDCLDKIKHLPPVDQLRVMWREEVRKQCDDANLHGLAAKLNAQQVVVAELSDCFQDMRDRMVFNSGRKGGG